YGCELSTPLSVKLKGAFAWLSLSGAVTVCFPARCASVATSEALPLSEPLFINHSCSFSAASRTLQCSIAATRSRTLPPLRPERSAAHDCDWQAQAFFAVLAPKLSLLSPSLCVGKGQRPRR